MVSRDTIFLNNYLSICYHCTYLTSFAGDNTFYIWFNIGQANYYLWHRVYSISMLILYIQHCEKLHSHKYVDENGIRILRVISTMFSYPSYARAENSSISISISF